MKLILLLIILSCLPALADTSSGVGIDIVKGANETWTLTYQTNRPADRLGFVRNPDRSRVERWSPASEGFVVSFIEGEEFIARKDGTSFSQVTLALTPTYKHLSKDYGPFSPYSDGGILIHTGRLFACINTCADDVNDWHISLSVPKDEHLIVNGQVYTKAANWVDGGDGKNVYIGKQQPIETESVIAVIDSGLPEEMKSSLSTDIPKLMNYYEARLGKLSGNKPTLYASYANITGGSSQGGTLPNQIFMHWNLDDLEEKVKDGQFINQTTWFFAHEVAHLFQRSKVGVLYAESNQSWLHEGNADWIAALALLDLYPESTQYVTSKIARFRDYCVKGLEQFPLIEAGENGQFGLYYTCGLLIHQSIDQAVQKKSDSEQDIYSVWNEFRRRVEQGEKKGTETFLAVVEQYASQDLVGQIRALVGTKLANPEEALDQLRFND